MEKLIKGYCKFLEWVLVACLALMVVLVFGNVMLRYAFNSGITVSEELARWLFVWMTFLGSIVALHENGHLGTDALTSRLSFNGKRICAIVAQLMMLYATWLLFSGSLTQVRINWEVQAPVTGASVAYFYASGIVFSVSTALMLLMQLWRTVSGQVTEAELSMSQESEEMAQLSDLHLDQSQTYKKN
jgi:TRAP-type C4-dicarboxylate transport system permease small subunit